MSQHSFPIQHIKKVSGHKSDSAIESYVNRLSEKNTITIHDELTAALGANPSHRNLKSGYRGTSDVVQETFTYTLSQERGEEVLSQTHTTTTKTTMPTDQETTVLPIPFENQMTFLQPNVETAESAIISNDEPTELAVDSIGIEEDCFQPLMNDPVQLEPCENLITADPNPQPPAQSTGSVNTIPQIPLVDLINQAAYNSVQSPNGVVRPVIFSGCVFHNVDINKN